MAIAEAKCNARAVSSPEAAASSQEVDIQAGSKARGTKALVEAAAAEVAVEVAEARAGQESPETTPALMRTCSNTGTKLVSRTSVRPFI